MFPQQRQALAAQHQARALAEANEHRRARDVMAIDGTPLRVRPITCDDRDELVRLFERLSPRSSQLRFFSPIRRLSDAQLLRLIDVDHQCRDALVALNDDDEIIAEARYDGECGSGEAEIALTVEDVWQHRGVGIGLARRLMGLAAERGYERLIANILPDNRAALGLVRELAPGVSVHWESGSYVATIPLGRAS